MFHFNSIAEFIILQLFAHVQEITLQYNYIGVTYTDLRSSRTL